MCDFLKHVSLGLILYTAQYKGMIPSISVTSVVDIVSVAFRFLPVFVCVWMPATPCMWRSGNVFGSWIFPLQIPYLPCPPTRFFCDFIIHFSDSFACHLALVPKGGGKGNVLSPLLRSQFQCLVQVFMVPPSALLTSPCCPCYLGTPHGLVMLKDWAVRWTLLTDADGHLLDANCLLNHKLTF